MGGVPLPQVIIIDWLLINFNEVMNYNQKWWLIIQTLTSLCQSKSQKGNGLMWNYALQGNRKICTKQKVKIIKALFCKQHQTIDNIKYITHQKVGFVLNFDIEENL